jgi:hypothetical protein
MATTIKQHPPQQIKRFVLHLSSWQSKEKVREHQKLVMVTNFDNKPQNLPSLGQERPQKQAKHTTKSTISS